MLGPSLRIQKKIENPPVGHKQTLRVPRPFQSYYNHNLPVPKSSQSVISVGKHNWFL